MDVGMSQGAASALVGYNVCHSAECRARKRSILVRNIPQHLVEFELKKALRVLFGSCNVPGACDTSAPGTIARNAMDPKKCEGCPYHSQTASTQMERNAKNQSLQLYQQLSGSLRSIRIATGERGGASYAVVDFSDEAFASAAIEAVGEMPTLPGTGTKVLISLHETWSAPLPVDEYHVYISGLPPGSTVENVNSMVKHLTGVPPVLTKVASVAGQRSRLGVREYAFLLFENTNQAEDAFQKLESSAAPLGIIIRRVEVHRRRNATTDTLTHSANCEIFIANLPPLTNSGELTELFTYFDDVKSAEVHPTRNFGFVRLASHEGALAAILHVTGIKIRGYTLACSWSVNRTPMHSAEETIDEEFEEVENAYAAMSKRSMEPESVPSASTTVSECEGQRSLEDVFDTSMPPEMASAVFNSFWLSLYATEEVTDTLGNSQQLMRGQHVKVGDSPTGDCATMVTNDARHKQAVQDWLSLEWVEDA